MQNPDQETGPNVLITGIPRSGTSFFCTLLHKVENCVAVNEPEEIFRYLDETAPPWGLAAFHAALRADILAGRPIANKIHQGRLIEDTAVVFNEELYRPEVSSPGFLLATKNTLAYLARLPYIASAMPKAAIVACVRNPFDTIASWKGTFAHLAGATVEHIRLGFQGDKLMRDAARARLDEIASTARVEARRALFWRHLALLILEDRQSLHDVIRYEDLTGDPEAVLRKLFARLPHAPAFKPLEPLAPSAVRTRRASSLAPDDFAAIREVCGETAAVFGYDLRQAPAAGID